MAEYVRGRPLRQTRRRRGVRVALVGRVVPLALVAAAVILVVRPWSPASPSGGGPGGEAGATAVATGLDPELERRFAAAQAAAAEHGVSLWVTSGWRSAAEQQALVDAAVQRHGSLDEARRWVLPPETSAHVTGLAIDVGPTEGALWLDEHGAQFGLCRTYANEVWHFEPVIEPGGRCPEMHPDSSGGWP